MTKRSYLSPHSVRRLLACLMAVGSATLCAAHDAQAAVITSFGQWATEAGPHMVIDFDDLPDGTVVTDQYSVSEPIAVVFESGGAGFLEIENVSGVAEEVMDGMPVSDQHVLDVESSNRDAIVARFVLPGTLTPTTVRAAGAWMIDLDSHRGGGRAEFYDANDNLIETLSHIPSDDSNVFFGLISEVGIARVVFDGAANGVAGQDEFVMIDDLALAAFPVPEPGSIGLWMIGSLLLCARHRPQATQR